MIMIMIMTKMQQLENAGRSVMIIQFNSVYFVPTLPVNPLLLAISRKGHWPIARPSHASWGACVAKRSIVFPIHVGAMRSLSSFS